MSDKRLGDRGVAVEGDRTSATGPVTDEPSALGAAATLPDQPRQRPTRADRREARRQDRRRTRQAESTMPPDDGHVEASGAYSDTVYVFESKGTTSTPVLPYVRALWDRREFMLAQARADLRGKRSSTVFGAIWGVLDPLIQAGLYFMVFTIIRRGGRPIDFLHVLIGGIFLFQLALASITEGGRSIRSSKAFMLNSTFPRAIFPIMVVCKGIMTFPPKVLVYAAFHVGLQAPVGRGLLLLPLLFGLQVVLMVGLALLVSTVTVLIKDADNAVQYVARLLFFITPVIYPLALIPDGVRAFVSWQPFFALFASYQEIFDGGVPGIGLLIQVLLWSVGLLVVGARVFLRHEREFAIRL
jgi:ABC-type polysaccharide/polyol phosphate export permease